MSLFAGFRDFLEELDHRERKAGGIILVLLVVSGIFWGLFYSHLGRLERQRQSLEKSLLELAPLKKNYTQVKQNADRLAARASALRPDDSIARIIDDIGIKGKGARVTPLKSERQGTLLQESADVFLDALTVNEAINLLYRLEKGGRPLVVAKAALKTRFGDPGRMDVVLRLQLIRPTPAIGS